MSLSHTSPTPTFAPGPTPGPTPLLDTVPAAILDTILDRLALLFISGAAGDLGTARQAASRMLGAYHAETEDELRLAAEIVSFGFHALEALSQAATPDMPLNKILRLRSSAVSLSRESHKAERRLDQLQKARRAGGQAQPAQAQPAQAQPAQAQPIQVPPQASQPAAEPSRPQIDRAIALIEATRQAMEAAGKPAAQTWTQAYNQRQTTRRIADNLRKHQSAERISSERIQIQAAAAAGQQAPGEQT